VARTKSKPKKAPKKTAKRPARRAAKTVARKTKPSHARAVGAKKKVSRSASSSKKDYGKRSDYGRSVDDFVAALPPKKREIVNVLREIVRDAVPGVAETIRWGMPVFARKKLICYAATKSDYVRFGFYARVELDDPDRRIAGSLAYVKLNEASEIERSLLHSWVQQIVEHTGA
jgi:hypothetical protein